MASIFLGRRLIGDPEKGLTVQDTVKQILFNLLGIRFTFTTTFLGPNQESYRLREGHVRRGRGDDHLSEQFHSLFYVLTKLSKTAAFLLTGS